MKSEKITEMEGTFIKIPFGEQEDKEVITLSNYECNILMETNISGVANVNKQIIDGYSYLIIQVNTYISFAQKLESKALDVELFRDFFCQLLTTCECLQTYLLKDSILSLDPEYIYYDISKNKFVFLPIGNKEGNIQEKFEKLFSFFTDWCGINERELLGYIFEVYGVLNENTWDILSFSKYVLENKGNNLCVSLVDETTGFEDVDAVCEENSTFMKKTTEEKRMEKTKVFAIIGIAVFLQILGVYFSYGLSYQFKYGVISITVSMLGVIMLLFETYNIVKNVWKRNSV